MCKASEMEALEEKKVIILIDVISHLQKQVQAHEKGKFHTVITP